MHAVVFITFRLKTNTQFIEPYYVLCDTCTQSSSLLLRVQLEHRYHNLRYVTSTLIASQVQTNSLLRNTKHHPLHVLNYVCLNR